MLCTCFYMAPLLPPPGLESCAPSSSSVTISCRSSTEVSSIPTPPPGLGDLAVGEDIQRPHIAPPPGLHYSAADIDELIGNKICAL